MYYPDMLTTRPTAKMLGACLKQGMHATISFVFFLVDSGMKHVADSLQERIKTHPSFIRGS